MGLWVYEIAPCPGRCGVTGGGRLPLVVVDCGAPGHLAVLAGRQRIVMTVRGNNAHVAAVMVGFTGVVILQVGGADLGNRRGYPARVACRPYIAKDS